MIYNVEFENMITHEKWYQEIVASDEDHATEICENMIGDQKNIMFEVREWLG